MTETIDCDICVIGGGSGGLSVASGAAQLGAKTVLFERGKMGGDCLNYGCVPSKALLAAAHSAHAAISGAAFGVHAKSVDVDFGEVMRHVKQAQDIIAPHDSVERFEGLGVRVIQAAAEFQSPRQASGGGVTVRAKRFVIAAGSRAAIPPIPGLETTRYLTNETLFDLNQRPTHLIIVGGGPIGIEMAQAFRRLGSEVTVLDGARILSKDDPELSGILRARLEAEGVTLREGVKIAATEETGPEISVRLEGDEQPVRGSHLLIATGRRPRVEGLGLERAGVAFDQSGIKVDARLRTTNRRIYAVGDIAGGPQFTHVAAYHAGIVVRNALFRLPSKVDYSALPWVTYTDPELAHVGMSETEARKRHGDGVRIVRAQFSKNDRAIAERSSEGLAKIVALENGKIIGASIAGPHAGELVHVWVLAIANRMKLSAFSSAILPYPTLGEIAKSSASAFYAPKLFSAWPKRIVRTLLALG